MRTGTAHHALALLAAMAVGGPVGAQTIEQRAAEVRQTLGAPPPIETVIDRGTRMLAPPAAAPSAAGAPTADPRSLGISPAPATAAGPNLLPLTGGTGTSAPGGSAFVNNPRGTGFLNDSRGTAVRGSPELTGGVGVRGLVPGLTVIRQPGDDQVTGTANLVTGTGRAPGLAP